MDRARQDSQCLSESLFSLSRIIDIIQNDGILPSVLDDPGQLLRNRGLQVTAQRLAVIQAVSTHPHSTADEVADAVRTQIGSISRQAVYDALGVLVEHRLVRRIQPAGSAARYEDRVGDNHHHLICRRCGVMVDIDCAVGNAPCLTADDDHGFDIDEAEVIYWGWCPECREAGHGVHRPDVPAHARASAGRRPRRGGHGTAEPRAQQQIGRSAREGCSFDTTETPASELATEEQHGK